MKTSLLRLAAALARKPVLHQTALFAALLLVSASGLARATAYTTTPDTVYYTPTGTGTLNGYVRVQYLGDTSGPGDHIHAYISSGSSYFSVTHDTVLVHGYTYWTVTYTIQSSAVTGSVTFSDDTTTRVVILKGGAAPDGSMTGVGPYYSNVPKNSTNCQNLRFVNPGADVDTLTSYSWSHSPGSIFVVDSSFSFPHVMHSGDTANWSICFHAPNDTNIYMDTLTVHYHDAYSTTRVISRVIYAKAVDTSIHVDAELSSSGPYWTAIIPKLGTNCQNMRLINTGTDVDTITSYTWSHDPAGRFVVDTTLSFPRTMNSHDTAYWNVCFHAPNDTNYYYDTITVHYKDAYNTSRSIWRIVYAHASDTTHADGVLYGYGPYYSSVPKNGSSCEPFHLYNTGSDVDTAVSYSWSHDPSGRFTVDSAFTFPHIFHSGDTALWSICFHAPNDTNVYTDTITVHYHDAYSQTRVITRIISAHATDTTSPDGVLQCIGPYWTATVPEGGTSCTNMRIINNGADVDTIESATWSHSPNGIFTLDSTVTLPRTLNPHDTLLWNACFHAPYDTTRYVDTLTLRYHDAYSQSRYVTRIVSGQATDTTIITCYTIGTGTVPFTEVGDTSRFRLFIYNHLDSTVNLTGAHFSGSGDASFLVDSSSFPRAIAGHHYDSVWLAFAPHASTSNTYSATLTATFTSNDTSHCHTAYASVTGHSAQTARDTQTVSLGDTTTKHIPLVGDSSSYYYSHRVDIVNNIGSRIRIDTITLTSTSHFYISENIRPTFPDTLVDGAKHSVIVHFYGDSSHTVYHDTLVVTMENALAPFYVYLDGYSNGASTSVVATYAPMPGADLQIYPNPSAGITNIELRGLSSVNIEVLNVLGEIVASHAGPALWQWNTGTAPLADGTCFVRATAKDAEGRDVVITRRLVVNHGAH